MAALIAPGVTTVIQGAADSYGFFQTARAWQYAANKGLTVPLRSSIVRSLLKAGSEVPSTVQLIVVVATEIKCLKQEVGCMNGQ